MKTTAKGSALHLGLLLLVVVASESCSVAAVHVQISSASINERGLCLVVDSFMPETSLVGGFKLKDRRQFLLQLPLPETAGTAVPSEMIQLPDPPDADDSRHEFVIASSAAYVIRLRNLSTVVVDHKAYAAGSIDILKPDARGSGWKVAIAWTKQPFLLSPSAARLVVKDAGTIKAFDLTRPEPTELHLPNLDKLFAAAGSRFRDEVKKANEDVANMVDSRPDYLGLTDDLDFGSADSGEIYAQLIYERDRDVSEAVPWRQDIVGSNASINTLRVRKVAGSWQYLGMLWTDKNRLPGGFAILDRQSRILHQCTMDTKIAEGYAVGKSSESWSPEASALVVFQGEQSDRLQPWRFVIWRYGRDKSMWSSYDVDPAKIFTNSDIGIVLKTHGPN